MKSSDKSHSNRNLDEWLSYLENIHSSEIDMGLERISIVAQKLFIDLSFAQVITVAGTNGKGTTCAFLENALLEKNKSVVVYSSPHIIKFNERLRINKHDVDDQALIDAFETIENQRGSVSLTYYEYTTLAAMLVIMAKQPDVVILEVGLGGRLDATNIIDADIAVITTVDLDHQEFLGDNRESIGFEKAGIMRANQQVVVGDQQPPLSVIQHAEKLNAQLYIRDVDFRIEQSKEKNTWQWRHQELSYQHLPEPNIPKDNIATALMVLNLLNISFSNVELSSLILNTKVSGRTEVVNAHCKVLLDVGHNPLAARYLTNQVNSITKNKVHAVVGMLADKDIQNTLEPLIPAVEHWYLATLDVPRGANADILKNNLDIDDKKVLTFDNVIDAYKMAISQAENSDLILVYGSFFTVAQVKAFLN
ncbi:bifunctional tetrahydrofolate synthase/dihydrofolate synthase [Colwelliaceae bacterium 6441]